MRFHPAVKIRPGRRDQVERFCFFEIKPDLAGVVIGRVDLEAGQAGVLQHDQVLMRRSLEIGPRVGQNGDRSDPGGFVHDLEKRDVPLRNVSRRAVEEKIPVKKRRRQRPSALIIISAQPGVAARFRLIEENAGDGHAEGSHVRGRRRHFLPGDPDPQRPEVGDPPAGFLPAQFGDSLHDRGDAGAVPGEERELAMKLPVVVHRRDFHVRDDFHAFPAPRLEGVGISGDVVVIGDGDRDESGVGGHPGQRVRRKITVARPVRVDVKVDKTGFHRSVFSERRR